MAARINGLGFEGEDKVFSKSDWSRIYNSSREQINRGLRQSDLLETEFSGSEFPHLDIKLYLLGKIAAALQVSRPGKSAWRYSHPSLQQDKHRGRLAWHLQSWR